MKLLKRIFGICETPMPANTTAWIMGVGKVKIDYFERLGLFPW